MNFDYFYGRDSESFRFIRLPVALMEDEYFKGLSIAFIGLKDQLEESTEENNNRIKAIDKELQESGNIDSLTEEIVAKYIKTIYISGKGIEKIEYC